MSELILRNGLFFIDGKFREGDLLIKNGRIERFGTIGGVHARREIDLKGSLVIPGVIDSHVHFGLEMYGAKSPDDYISGGRSAIYGGVLTVMDFTEQYKGEALSESLKRKLKEAERSPVDYSIHINVTDFKTNYKDEIKKLIERGIKSFKFFTAYASRGLMARDDELYEAFEVIRDYGGIAMVHCENGYITDLLTERFIKEGKTSPIYHALSRPPFTEGEAISRVLYIAEATGCPVYIVHVSTKEGVEEIKRAKRRGVKIYAETCPHYLVLTEEKLKGDEGIYYIATPPLRREEDREALWDGIKEGVIDVIATDHAAYTREQKLKGEGHFYKTPGGLSGVETLMPILLTEGEKRGIEVEKLIPLITENPARIFGIDKGTIKEGQEADLVVLKEEEKVLTHDSLHGSVDFCPYNGMKINYSPHIVIKGGEIVLEGGHYTPLKGKFLLNKEVASL